MVPYSSGSRNVPCTLQDRAVACTVTSDITGPSRQHMHVLRPTGRYMQNQKDLKIRCHSVIKYESHDFFRFWSSRLWHRVVLRLVSNCI